MLKTFLIIIAVLSIIFAYFFIEGKRFEHQYGNRKCEIGEKSYCQYWQKHDICPKDAAQPFCIEIGYCSKWTCIEDNRPWYKQILY